MSTAIRVINYIKRSNLKNWRLIKAKKLGIKYVSPNFLYLPMFSDNSIVIDVGCSHEADFSLYMMKNYGVKAYAVDPTKKHATALHRIQTSYENKFKYLPYALTAKDQMLDFYESKTNESGSILRAGTI